MSLETTIRIHATTMRLINDACGSTCIRRNDMIVYLLKKTLADTSQKFSTGRLVRYQERDRRESWHTIHVRLKEDEADFFKDLRGFLRLSVSLILAVATRAYLHEIFKKSGTSRITDNYPYSNYLISRIVSKNIISWIIYWGYPEDLG